MSVSAATIERPNGAMAFRRQAAIGIGLAAALFGAWLALHVYGVFLYRFDGPVLLVVPLMIALQCWLSVGLFIVSHDAMHGSLAPFRPRLNRAIGRMVLLAYAGIWYDDLVDRHFAHHRAPGTEADPDFAGDGRVGVLRWYGRFFMEYLTLGQLLRQAGLGTLYLFGFGVRPQNLMLFWAVPALLSAIQLFYFGTYLPHRREAEEFSDHHRTRTNDYSLPVSLLTCFHFGYHHEHHEHPAVPWWRLPAVRGIKASPKSRPS